MCRPILKFSCQQYTNLVVFLLCLIVVSKFVLSGQGSMKNIVFRNKTFLKKGTFFHLLITVLKHLLISFGKISLPARAQLRKFLKVILNFCKLQVVCKSEIKLSNIFRFKDRLPFSLVSGVVYKYVCGRCSSIYYLERDRRLKVSSGEPIGTFDI